MDNVYGDQTLQNYLLQLQQCSTDLTRPLPGSLDVTALAGAPSLGPTASGQLNFDAIDQSFAQAASPLELGNTGSHAQEPAQQEPAMQKDSNKQSAEWIARNRKNQKQYRLRQKVQKQQMEQQLKEMAAQVSKLQLENRKIAGRNSTLETLLSFRGKEIADLQARNNIMAAESDQQPFQSKQDGQKSSAFQSIGSVIEAYRANVNVMAGLLLQLDQHAGQGNPSADVMQSIRQAVMTSAQISMRAAVLSPDSIMQLMQANLQSPQGWQDSANPTCQLPDDHWQKVADIMQLRPDQQQVMADLRAYFAQQINGNRKKRGAICLGLQQGTDSMKRYHAAVGTEAQKYVATNFEVYSEVSRLRDNLREQHRIWIDFYASVFKVWDLVQHCQAVVHSFPRYPDIVAICKCVAESLPSGAPAP